MAVSSPRTPPGGPTPGPWQVTHELRERDETVCDLVNNTWVIVTHGRLGSWNADAELIAAAPDLLAALEEIMEHNLPIYPADWQRLTAQGEAAIKKARGA